MAAFARTAVNVIIGLFAIAGFAASLAFVHAQTRAPLADPTIEHVGIIVGDVRKTIRDFEEAFGIDIPEPTEYGPLFIPDKPDAKNSAILMVLFNIGTLKIELVQPLRGPGAHRDHLDTFGPGLHHIALRVRDQQGAIASLSGRFGRRTGQTYVDMKETLGFTAEVMAQP